MNDDTQAPSGDNNQPWSLAELSSALKKSVEGKFDDVQVKAEISRPTRAASGHVYFTLKDEDKTLDAVCWRPNVAKLAVQPEDGLEVIAHGGLTIYPGRSKYQIIIKQLELAGEGALLKQLEDRKKRLMAEGLFAPESKQAIPAMPSVIGVITSPTGAVIRDILHRLRERYPLRVIVWPVLVQGDGAAEQITAAIRGFDALLDSESPPVPIPDVVIVARGGGGLEDLMAFNEEEVVRSVAACRLPIISAVGHETDTTLIDFAADLRAPTPTAAAELATPVKAELIARINDFDTRLVRQLQSQLEQFRQHLHHLHQRLGTPQRIIELKTQRLDLALGGFEQKAQSVFSRSIDRLRQWADRLIKPERQVLTAQSNLTLLSQRLQEKTDSVMLRNIARLDAASRLLEASSFQRVLARGFALVTGADGQVMRHKEQYDDGTPVMIRLADGVRSALLGEGGKKQKDPKKAPKKDSEQDDLF